MQFINTSK